MVKWPRDKVSVIKCPVIKWPLIKCPVTDICSGYYHIMIPLAHRTFLGFEWKFKSGRHAFFVWNVSFLGISDMVFFFSKMKKPIISFMISRGVATWSYIDDVMVTWRSEAKCKRNQAFFRNVLRCAGFVESIPKAKTPVKSESFSG